MSLATHEIEFQTKLQNSSHRVKQILGQTKNPLIATSDINHSYDDKYLLSEFLCNISLASQITFFQHLGISNDLLEILKQWCFKNETVTLRFRTEEKCTFIKTEIHEEDSGHEHRMESNLFGTISNKVITKIKEYVWKVEIGWEIVAFPGVGIDSCSRLCGRKGEVILKTTCDTSPFPSIQTPSFEKDFNMTWFLQQIKMNQKQEMMKNTFSPKFSIDRQDKQCYTPSRNNDIELASNHHHQLDQFCRDIHHFISKMIHKLGRNLPQKIDLVSLDDPKYLFIPVMPLFDISSSLPSSSSLQSSKKIFTNKEEEDHQSTSQLIQVEEQISHDHTSMILDVSSINQFIQEENRLLTIRYEDFKKMFKCSNIHSFEIFTSNEAHLFMICGHMMRVCHQWKESIAYIEVMLRSQLIKAIGHEITPCDFDDYMSFHYHHFFIHDFKPKPMIYTIRRSHLHSPEGTISINMMYKSNHSFMKSQVSQLPIQTFCSLKKQTIITDSTIDVDDDDDETKTKLHSNVHQDMGFSINAATRITCQGDRYLHGWLRHDFSDSNHELSSTKEKISLNVGARQFCGFIVIVGRILDANNIDPQQAFLVQNRDEIEVPLSISTIPSAKEFNDSILSLSPEQQSFAKAFRSMQLGATLMGILVIQIKPQLEAVLNLPQNSLTKEIKLTKQLFSLFIDYQIPSDLLNFTIDDNVDDVDINKISNHKKLNIVKGNVCNILELISEFKKDEIHDQNEKKQYESSSFRSNKDNNFEEEEEEEDDDDDDDDDVYYTRSNRYRSMNGPSSNRHHVLSVAAQSANKEATSSTSSSTISTRKTDIIEHIHEKSSEPQEEQEEEMFDFSRVATEIDSRTLELDPSLRPTIIKPSNTWSKKNGAKLVMNEDGNTTSPVELGSDEQKLEKDRAFDLLDALTRSGSLPLSHATLHVIVCATLSFDDSVVDTVIKKNVNPIEQAERSSMLMAGVVHGLGRYDARCLVQRSHLSRAEKLSPALFGKSL